MPCQKRAQSFRGRWRLVSSCPPFTAFSGDRGSSRRAAVALGRADAGRRGGGLSRVENRSPWMRHARRISGRRGDLTCRRRPHSGRPRPQLPTSPDNLSAHRPPFAHSHTLPLLTLSYIALGVAHAPRHHNLTRRPWPAATIGRDTHHADDARTACVHPRRRLLRGRKLHVAEW